MADQKLCQLINYESAIIVLCILLALYTVKMEKLGSLNVITTLKCLYTPCGLSRKS